MWTWTRSSCPSKSCSIPSLKGKAVVVGGRPNERGVVSAASYEARKFGVHSAMPLRTAARVQMASIDEAYMDMTGTERLHGPPFTAAHVGGQARTAKSYMHMGKEWFEIDNCMLRLRKRWKNSPTCLHP